MRTMALHFAIACSALIGAEPAGAATPADEAFASLKTLVGRWQGPTSGGRTLDIRYKLIANDSVLVETWRSASGPETMTVYHRDGPDLVATHYCAQGNQPRLRLAGITPAGRMHFVFRDATNLKSDDAAHLHEFWVEPGEAGTIKRSETYREKGEAGEESAVLRRTPAP